MGCDLAARHCLAQSATWFAVMPAVTKPALAEMRTQLHKRFGQSFRRYMREAEQLHTW